LSAIRQAIRGGADDAEIDALSETKRLMLKVRTGLRQ